MKVSFIVCLLYSTFKREIWIGGLSENTVEKLFQKFNAIISWEAWISAECPEYKCLGEREKTKQKNKGEKGRNNVKI